jgi:hypothetical protein
MYKIYGSLKGENKWKNRKTDLILLQTQFFPLTWIYSKTMNAMTQLSDMELIRFFLCKIFFPNLEQLIWKKKERNKWRKPNLKKIFFWFSRFL